ncbi:DUF3617 domain-containing protein [Porphyrobacter sp. AAP82]|uniref:DUF3617 domain-containing protein n=1 Tax=Porphyrobacter sp. AAP82 TaxID=1248917 RepID=UPI000317C697|nr:DUF3617 domain-containing protein [Porphyrobacter sp. AAP82]
MTRTTILAAAAAAVTALLAGCSGGGTAESGKNGTAGGTEAAEQAQAQIPRPRPGLYKTTVTMTNIAIPGVPDGHGAGQIVTTEDCLTKADVDKGFEEMVRQGQDGECTYERFAMADGKLDAVMVCAAKGRTSRIAMQGTITPTGSDLEAATDLEFEGMGKGRMTFTVKHERLGECPAAQASEKPAG